MRGNHWREALTRYDGQVPSPFAIYRPPVMGDFMPYELGICSYQIPTVASCHTLEELATAITDIKARIAEIHTEAGMQPLNDEQRAEFAALKAALGDDDGFEAAYKEVKARIPFHRNPQKRSFCPGLNRSAEGICSSSFRI